MRPRPIRWGNPHPPRAVRGLRLTDKALDLLGHPRPVEVPLLVVPWRPDSRDRGASQAVQVHVPPPDLDAIRAEGYHAGLRDGRGER